MKANWVAAGLIVPALLLGACGSGDANDDAETVQESEEVEKKQDEEQRETQITGLIEELQALAATRDYETLSEVIRDSKRLELNTHEGNQVLKVVDGIVDTAIAEQHPELIKTNSLDVQRLTEFSKRYGGRDYAKEIKDVARTHRNEAGAERSAILDKMEAALTNKDYATVEDMYLNEPGIKGDRESSAMYHYSLYLKKGERSRTASLELAKAVPYSYHGRFREEIEAAVYDESYGKDPATGLLPLNMSSWVHIEHEVAFTEQQKENTERWKAEEEAALEEARGQNPRIGMTQTQVEVSNWGLPEDVNRTVTQYSTHEQWVYGNGQYLYFTDGILTSFQD